MERIEAKVMAPFCHASKFGLKALSCPIFDVRSPWPFPHEYRLIPIVLQEIFYSPWFLDGGRVSTSPSEIGPRFARTDIHARTPKNSISLGAGCQNSVTELTCSASRSQSSFSRHLVLIFTSSNLPPGTTVSSVPGVHGAHVPEPFNACGANDDRFELLCRTVRRSVQLGNHLLLRHRCKVVDVKPLGGKDRLDVGWDELGIQVWCNGEFCGGTSQ